MTARSCYQRRNGPKTFKHRPEQIVSPTASMAIDGIAARKMDFIGVMPREVVSRDERRRRSITKRLRQRSSLAET